MSAKTCTNCRRSRSIDAAMRCEERRSSAIDGVIILDVDQAKRVGTLERICALLGAR